MDWNPLATPQDVENRWRPLLEVEQVKVETLIDDASALLRAEFPGIDDQITAGGLSESVVAAVVASMVKRAMAVVADGVSQDSQTVGPYSHSQQFANPMGNVFLTAAERVLIEGRRRKAMSVRFS